MEDHPMEIQTVWIYKPNENGNPPERTQTAEIKDVHPRVSSLTQAGEAETLRRTVTF